MFKKLIAYHMEHMNWVQTDECKMNRHDYDSDLKYKIHFSMIYV